MMATESTGPGEPMPDSHDVIVVGAGSSGAVMAARLSEDPHRRVLLLEAGPDPGDSWPAELLDANEPVLKGWNWPYTAHRRQAEDPHSLSSLGGSARILAAAPRDAWSAAKAVATAPRSEAASLHTMPYVPGRVVGGSSAVNGALALRPSAADFDDWLPYTGPDWAWEQVLPAFVHLERDLGPEPLDPHQPHDPLHGRDGPMPIARDPLHALSPQQAAFREACLARGWPAIADLNTDAGIGIGVLPRNVVDGRRVSTAQAYISPARARSNLHIRDNARVRRVVFENGRAVGVEVDGRGGTECLRAAEVVLCSGAINTPALLMRSGIGAAAQCRDIGVPLLVDRPGVGQNLADHPSLMFWMVPSSDPAQAFANAPQHQVMARARSGHEARPDLNLFLLGHFQTTHIPMLANMLRTPRAHALSVVLTRPRSRGHVWLKSADPDVAPVIDLNLAASADDVQRLMAGARLAWDMVQSAPLRRLWQSVFMWNASILGNDNLLRGAVLRMVSGTWHASGTARMGALTDPLAVVDAACRVHGVPGLRVVDASVMPSIPSTPTSLTCIMLAERVAAWMRQRDAAGGTAD